MPSGDENTATRRGAPASARPVPTRSHGRDDVAGTIAAGTNVGAPPSVSVSATGTGSDVVVTAAGRLPTATVGAAVGRLPTATSARRSAPPALGRRGRTRRPERARRARPPPPSSALDRRLRVLAQEDRAGAARVVLVAHALELEDHAVPGTSDWV